MSDKKDLLNDLKIDRSDNNNSEKPPLLKIITLVVASIFILAVTKFIFLSEDELLEVTPSSLRLRKKFLDPIERKRQKKSS